MYKQLTKITVYTYVGTGWQFTEIRLQNRNERRPTDFDINTDIFFCKLYFYYFV